MKVSLLIFVVLAAVLPGCREPQKDWDEELKNTETYYFVSNVPETQKVGELNLGLEVLLSRNFMPGPDTIRPLVSFVTLKELGKKDITGAFELETLEIITSAKRYKPSFKINAIEPNEKWSIKWLSVTGPELDPAKLVDVICEFKETKTGRYYSLIARRQRIRTSS